MRFQIKRHMMLGRVLVPVFFAVNCGFTGVLRDCKMQDMRCCENSKNAEPMTCCQPSSPLSLSYTYPAAGCHTNTIVVGLTGNSAALEKTNKPQESRIAAVPSVKHLHASLSERKTSSLLFSSSSENVFARSVEKYILNASFLI